MPARAWNEVALEAALLLPNLLKLLTRLMRDPRVPIRRKVFIGAVMAYVVSPIDLIPDFVVGLGRLDDIILVSLAVDHLMNGSEEALVLKHWDGTIDALDLVRSIFCPMTRVMAAESTDQRSVSLRSCVRPRRVSR